MMAIDLFFLYTTFQEKLAAGNFVVRDACLYYLQGERSGQYTSRHRISTNCE